MGHFYFAFLTVCFLAVSLTPQSAMAESATTQSASVKPLPEIAENLGVQVRKATLMRADLGKNAAGDDVFYAVLMGEPATMVVMNVKTAKVEKAVPLPHTSGAWGVKVSADGTVYLGAYNQGLLYRYFPKTGELKNLGFPFPKTRDAVLYPMDTSPDGKIYGGSYPSGHEYEFDPATGKFRDLGQMTNIEDEERWIRVTVYDDENKKLYLGIGNSAQLVEYDLATGKKRNLLPEKYSNITAVYDMNLADGKLICRKETHDANTYFVLDAKTGKEIPVTDADTGITTTTFQNSSRCLSPVAPVANKMYFAAAGGVLREYDLDTDTIRSTGRNVGGVFIGYGFAKLDDPEFPGYSLVGVVGMAGKLIKYNLQTGKLKMQQVQLPANPINIHDVEKGPDGKIYSGGYLAGNVGIYDPQTGKSHYETGVGQSENITVAGDSVYFGVYPGARVYEYNTKTPWGTTTAKGANPRRIMDLRVNPDIPGYAGQDRPFGMAGSADMQKLFVGTVPKNKQWGGVFAVYDLKTDAKPEIYWNLIKDQSIVSLVYKDGIVYGGTSIYGGLGGNPKAKQAVLFGWDVAKKKKLFEIAPVPGKSSITSLLVRPDGNIWGFANGALFVFDSETREVIYQKNEFPKANGSWIEATMVNGEDGNVYAVVGGTFIRIDAKTKQVTRLATSARKVTRDDAGDFYLAGYPLTVLYKVSKEKVAADGNDIAAR